MTKTITISGYITNLGAYVRGELVGRWISFPLEEDKGDILESIGIYPGGPDEEYFFTDWDCELDGLSSYLGEYMSIDDVEEIAEQLDEWGDPDTFAAACEVFDVSEVLEHDENDYILYTDVEDYTDLGLTYAEETCMLDACPDSLRGYIDFAAIGRDHDIDCYGGFCSAGYIECIA